MSDASAPAATAGDLDRLADREEALAGKEAELLEHERSVIKRERAYIGQRMGLSDTARALADRAATLHARASALGDEGRAISMVTVPRPDRFAEDEPRGYKELEVARARRMVALEAREHALGARGTAVHVRRDCIDREEKALEYRRQLYALRGQELDRLERMLGDESAEDPPPSPLSGEAAAEAATRSNAPMGEPLVSDERRDTQRFGLKVYVGLESEHNFYTGFSRNISAGGLVIATHDVLEVGGEVELLFHLPSGDSIHTPGRVAWIRDYNPAQPEMFPGMGVKFVDLTPDDAVRIRRFAGHREPLFYDDD